MQVGIAARDPLLESILPDEVRWVLDAWLVLHDEPRRLPMLRLPAAHLSGVLPALLRTDQLPVQSTAAIGQSDDHA